MHLNSKALALTLAIVLVSLAAQAQRRMPFCNVVAIESQRVGNAVQVVIRTDGIMRLQFEPSIFFDQSVTQEDGVDPRKPVMEIPFRITNARSQVNSFTDVGIYPVSHVETSLPSDTPDGLGVDVKIVLFAPGVLRSGRLSRDEELNIDLPYPGPSISVRLTEDQRSLIILVTSDRRTLPPVQRRKPGEATPSEVLVAADDGTVTIEAINADLRDLMRQFTVQTGVDVRLDPDLQRSVSLCLQEMPPLEALEAIANAYGLQLGRLNGTWVLSEGAVGNLSTYLESHIEKVSLSYISAAAARNSLPEFLLHYVRINAGENSLTIIGPPALVQKVREDIRRLDRPVPHVRIEALIVEMSDTLDSEQLLQLTLKDSDQSMQVNVATGDIFYRKLGAPRDDFEARLRALAVQDKVRIRATPYAIALNGQKARLFSGQQRYIKADYFDQWRNVFITRLLPVQVGISLEMTCWVGAEEVILASVIPEVTAVADVDFMTGLPTVATRRAETTVMLRDGETLFIGGLHLQQRESTTHKVPILGDLPLIGGLFRIKTPRDASTELAIFITPRITTQRAEVTN